MPRQMHRGLGVRLFQNEPLFRGESSSHTCSTLRMSEVHIRPVDMLAAYLKGTSTYLVGLAPRRSEVGRAGGGNESGPADPPVSMKAQLPRLPVTLNQGPVTNVAHPLRIPSWRGLSWWLRQELIPEDRPTRDLFSERRTLPKVWVLHAIPMRRTHEMAIFLGGGEGRADTRWVTQLPFPLESIPSTGLLPGMIQGIGPRPSLFLSWASLR